MALDFSHLSAYLKGVNSWVEEGLQEYLPAEEPQEYLYRLAKEYPQRESKRLRPALVWLSCACCGGEIEKALPSAMALELFQNFALVHDDIEDSSLLRRGQPTLHRCYGIPLALNVGDLLLELSFEALLRNPSLLGDATSLEVLKLFCQLVRKTLEGQAMDIGWVREQHFPSRQQLMEMMNRKTSWYSGRGPCEMGALIAQASPGDRHALGQYGKYLGLGFQLRDDILNLSSTNEAASGYGKEHGGDFAEGKRTLIVLEMLERLDSAKSKRFKRLLFLQPAKTPAEEIHWAVEQAHACGAVETVYQQCQQFFQQAVQFLQPLAEHPGKVLLEQLATDWLSLPPVVSKNS